MISVIDLIIPIMKLILPRLELFQHNILITYIEMILPENGVYERKVIKKLMDIFNRMSLHIFWKFKYLLVISNLIQWVTLQFKKTFDYLYV